MSLMELEKPGETGAQKFSRIRREKGLDDHDDMPLETEQRLRTEEVAPPELNERQPTERVASGPSEVARAKRSGGGKKGGQRAKPRTAKRTTKAKRR